MRTIATWAAILSIVGAGLIGGLLFAFSTAVMPALRKVPGEHGMRVMQVINRDIQNPVFLLTFMGAALTCLAVAVLAPFDDLPGAGLRMAGALAYLVGVIGVTFAVNIPLNNAVDAADPANSQELWARYLSRWTAWNHLRTVAGAASVLLLALGVRG